MKVKKVTVSLWKNSSPHLKSFALYCSVGTVSHQISKNPASLPTRPLSHCSQVASHFALSALSPEEYSPHFHAPGLAVGPGASPLAGERLSCLH